MHFKLKFYVGIVLLLKLVTAEVSNDLDGGSGSGDDDDENFVCKLMLAQKFPRVCQTMSVVQLNVH